MLESALPIESKEQRIRLLVGGVETSWVYENHIVQLDQVKVALIEIAIK